MSVSAIASDHYESQRLGDKTHPKDIHRCNPFVQLLETYMDVLIWKSRNRDVRPNDMYKLPKIYEINSVAERFHKAYAREKVIAKAAGRKPTFGWPWFSTVRFRLFTRCLFWWILYSLTFIAQPQLIRAILLFFDGTPNGWFDSLPGWGIALLLFADSLFMSLFLQNGMRESFQVGMEVRTLVMSVVYSKSLKLSSASRQSDIGSQAVTLMNVDAERMCYATTLGINFAWWAPLMLLILSLQIVQEIGWGGALAVLGSVVVLQGCSAMTARLMSRSRQLMTHYTGVRVKLIREVLQGIRVIKAYAWEQPTSAMIQELRSKELGKLAIILVLMAINYAIMFVTPVLAGIAGFVVFQSQGGALSASTVFTTFAAINLMRLPVKVIPMVVARFIDMHVSLGRLSRFMDLPEVAPAPPEPPRPPSNVLWRNVGSPVDPDAPLVHLREAAFKWGEIPEGESVESKSDSKNERPSKDHAEAKADVGQAFTLQVSDFAVGRGELVCVIGHVGSGKSSLLSAILGEMEPAAYAADPHADQHPTGPLFKRPARPSLVAQLPWIQNRSLKESILFGRPMDTRRYNEVLEACQLLPDLDMLPARDDTEIGERGINISGGQKQRVAIARACYHRDTAEVFLMDDPLSAVDVHVAGALFERVVCGCLREAARVLVLNSHYHLLRSADRIVLMEQGAIVAQGSYADLEAQSPEFRTLLQLDKEQVQVGPDSPDTEASPAPTPGTPKPDADKRGPDPNPNSELGKRLVKVEHKHTGAVTLATYAAYYSSAFGVYDESSATGDGVYRQVKMVHGVFMGLLVLGVFVVGQVLRTMDDIFLTEWTDATHRRYVYEMQLNVTAANATALGMSDEEQFWLMMYAVFGVLTTVAYMVSSAIFMLSAVAASRNFHNRIFKSVLRGSVNLFFDVQPLGRILNRFTSDIDRLDNLLPEYLIQVLQNVLFFVAAAVLCCVANWRFIFFMPPVAAGFVVVAYLFKRVFTEYRRIENISRSPVVSSLSESLYGLETIRAFRLQDSFVKAHNEKVNRTAAAYMHYQLCGIWFAMRIDFLGAVIVLGVALMTTSMTESNVSDSWVGLALAFAVQFTSLMQWTVRVVIETESNMSSVERLLHYSTSIPLEKEEPDTLAAIDEHWPPQGAISFENVYMRYRPLLPLILQGITFQVNPREKVGIVGRTGAGKSSLVSALLRLCELHDGRVLVDGVDTRHVPLSTLRSKVSIIPQEPFLFSTTIRDNLDPYRIHSDEDIWSILSSVRLSDMVKEFPKKLLHPVTDKGDNLSAGTRQLICIGRALLRRSKIVFMDEATANVDTATDALIQDMMRSEFADCTVLTIAHRLETVLGSDRVLVLDEGRVAEYDAPQVLMKRPDSLFHVLLKKMNEQNKKVITNK